MLQSITAGNKDNETEAGCTDLFLDWSCIAASGIFLPPTC